MVNERTYRRMASDYPLDKRHLGKTVKEQKLVSDTKEIMEFCIIKSIIDDSDDDSNAELDDDDDDDDDTIHLFKLMALINHNNIYNNTTTSD